MQNNQVCFSLSITIDYYITIYISIYKLNRHTHINMYNKFFIYKSIANELFVRKFIQIYAHLYINIYVDIS